MAKTKESTAITFNHESVSLRALEKGEIIEATNLLMEALEAVNKTASKQLYLDDAETTQAYLEGVSHLYGAFDKASNELVGMIAVEEDAIERVAVKIGREGEGIGAEMMRAVRIAFGAEYADVYEANSAGLHFFEAVGMSMYNETAPEEGDLMAENPHKVIHLMY